MASGDTLAVILPQMAEFSVLNFATFDERNTHSVLDFDAAVVQIGYFGGVLPSSYFGNGLTISIIWMASSATAGNVEWGASIERHEEGVTDLDTVSFGPEQTVVSAAQAINGTTSYADITMTDGAQIDNLQINESFRLRIRRLATSGSDTMTGDAEILRIEIRET